MTSRTSRPFVLTTLAASFAATAIACGSADGSNGSSDSGSNGAGAESDALSSSDSSSSSATSSSTSSAVASTTRTALGANNTSASSLFRDTYTPSASFFGSTIGVVSNGDNPTASATASTLNDGAVSKVSLHTLLPAGSTTKIFFETQSWFCTNASSSSTSLSSALGSDLCGSHIDIGYADNDTAQAARQVADMRSRGADGLLIDWSGPATLAQNTHVTSVSQINDGALFGFKTAAEASGGAFTFAVVEDEGAKAGAKANGGDWTSAILSDLTYLANNVFGSSAYYTSGTGANRRPVVFFFGVDHYAQAAGSSIDWTTVRAKAPGNPLFVFEDTGHALADGGYSWPEPTAIADYPGKDPFDVVSYLPYFYSQASKLDLAFGAAFKGFDDHVVNGWVGPSSSKPSYTDGERYIGQQCGKTWLDSFKMASANAGNLAGVQLPTWDDYEEGTELETGIDNHLAVTPALSGSTVSWTLAAASDAPADCTGAVTAGFDLTDTVNHFAVYASPANDGENLTLVADNLAPTTRSFDLTGKLPAGKWLVSVRAVGQPSITNKLSSSVAFTSTSAGGGGGGGGGDAGTACTGVPVITEPFGGESVGPSIELKVTAPSCIETMIVYIDGEAATPAITGSSIDQWIPVSLGAHTVNVNGWAGSDVAHSSATVSFTRTY